MVIIILLGLFFFGGVLFFTVLGFKPEETVYEKKITIRIAIFFWLGFIYILTVNFTATRNPGCVEWHSFGSNPRTVTDGKRLVNKVWKDNSHLEWDIDYVPYDCDCVTYHWLFVAGDWNDFTQDSVIKGQFKGPTVKPNKLINFKNR